jgi:hypothetical protein
MAQPENPSAETENVHHTYVTHRIPWYVHVMWVLFWILAIAYILIYQLPQIPREIQSPP